MTIEEMKRIKREMGYSNKTVSEQSGVPLGTVQKVLSGATASPRSETLRALESFFLKEGNKRTAEYSFDSPESLYVRDSSAARDPYSSDNISYNKDGIRRGPYTIDDYRALPDDVRAELIDGMLIKIDSPVFTHQAIAGYIHARFLNYVQANKGPCYPIIAPMDVQLDMDEYTVVQPDVLIICSRDKLKNGRVYGAPDFVLEVLSPSTRKKDMQQKVYKYGYAGVREYWIVDPETRMVIQYDFEHELPPKLYSFDDTVPVLIWDGRCSIDFKELMNSISWADSK